MKKEEEEERSELISFFYGKIRTNFRFQTWWVQSVNVSSLSLSKDSTLYFKRES